MLLTDLKADNVELRPENQCMEMSVHKNIADFTLVVYLIIAKNTTIFTIY